MRRPPENLQPVRDVAASARVPELEGLRALLAWTVVAVHILISCGWFGPTSNGTPVLAQVAVGAVDLFMLLSGFAITRLIVVQCEPFHHYLWRRACRIVPAYWVALAAAVALNGLLIRNLGHLPATPERDGSLAICQLAEARMWIDLPLHLSLLHGLIPAKVLPFEPFTFLGAAWSLSLEWQFYCVAPLAVFVALRSWIGAAIVLALAAITLLLAGKTLAMFSEAFLPVKAAFFVVGGLSYFAMADVRSSRLAAVLLIAPVTILALAWWAVSGRSIEAVIAGSGWVVITAAVHFRKFDWLRNLLNSDPMQFLGRVSYSTYLFHAPVLVVVQAAIWHWLHPGGFWQLLAATTVVGTIGTLIVSALSWHFIERPFQQIGRGATGEKRRDSRRSDHQ